MVWAQGTSMFNKPGLEELLRDCDSRFELWARLLDVQQVRRMVEIGVWKGDFSAYILGNCRNLDRYYMIDPWANLPDWNKPSNVAPGMFAEIYQEMLASRSSYGTSDSRKRLSTSGLRHPRLFDQSHG